MISPKKILFLTTFVAAVSFFGLVLSGCDQVSDSDDNASFSDTSGTIEVGTLAVYYSVLPAEIVRGLEDSPMHRRCFVRPASASCHGGVIRSR